MPHGLDYEISQQPDFAMVNVRLKAGEQLFAEPSAMATMDPGIELKAGLKGGLKRSLGRALGGESLIMNTFTAQDGPGEVALAPGCAGDVAHHRLDGAGLLIQRGAYLAHGQDVEVTGSWQGARGFFSGEGLILLKASGNGDIFFNSYGAITAIDVKDDFRFIVDSGYIVAFEDTLTYEVSVLAGLRPGSTVKSFLFGGEGLVCRFSGTGRLWIQTRFVHPFLRWIHPFRRVQRSNK